MTRTGSYTTRKSSEILPATTIAAAKRQMSAKQYRQEYEASFEGATGRICEDYGKANHTGARIEPHEQLLWMHDRELHAAVIGCRRTAR
ncbi:hypothetical protein ACU4GD_28030 [Cupriavidus basilensis]